MIRFNNNILFVTKAYYSPLAIMHASNIIKLKIDKLKKLHNLKMTISININFQQKIR